MNPQLPQPGQVPVAPSVAPVAAAPVQADNSDVIEATWVAKAQQIVAQTTQDPYEQARALNALKADYMLKRYGKEVKVVDDA